jgi:hypothetical protein
MSILDPDEQQAAETAELKTSFDPLPAGKYACQLTEMHKHTNPAGNTTLKNTWRIADGLQYGGRLFFNYASLKPENLGRVRGIYEAIGAPMSAEESDVVGRSAWVTVNVKADTRSDHLGEFQNNIQIVTKYDGAPLPTYIDPNAGPSNPDADIDDAFGPAGGGSEEDLV